MSKMTDELIEKLYGYGKKVYVNEIDLHQAADDVLLLYGSFISKSSALFYIGLVKDLIDGKGSTWNQNTDLLVYYVDHITRDFGKDAGSKALQGGMKFAVAKSRKPLIKALNELKDKYNLENVVLDIRKQEFIDWLKHQKRQDGTEYKTATIYRYAKALELITEQIADLEIESTNLFYYYSIETFSVVEKKIRENPNFNDINRLSKNGNGDLSAGMNLYKQFLSEKENSKTYDKKNKELPFDSADMLDDIIKYIASKGFMYSNSLIKNFYLSLKSKPFVLLAGTSGTGKTRLVRLFAEAIGAFEDGRYKQVAVKPDWSDSTDLFGHVNLKNEFVPGAIVEFIKKAADDQEKLPYILCLDEMNLARVEYYFSDFLSVMETRDWLGDTIITDRLVPKGCYSGDIEAEELYGNLGIPENLYIVGTVNMDETTFPFSKKVLDRANTIEFSIVDLELPDVIISEEVVPIKVGNDFLRANYLNLRNDCVEHWEAVKTYNNKISKINEILKSSDAQFGYRVRDEIIFYMLYNEEMGVPNEKEAFDYQIMQKILPRIQGSSESIASILKELFKEICAGPFAGQSGQSDAQKMSNYLKEGKTVDYPMSARKICMMLRRYEDDDFTSFWV